jgi:predicted SprT family Zn-dependent metalloprotease
MNVSKALMMLQDLTLYYTGNKNIKCSINKRLKAKLGRTGMTNRTFRVLFIDLSHQYVVDNTEAHVLDIILHEIAHARTPGHFHDYVWESVARKMGCLQICRVVSKEVFVNGIGINELKKGE